MMKRRKKLHNKIYKPIPIKQLLIFFGVYMFAITVLISICLCSYYNDLRVIEETMQRYHDTTEETTVETTTETTTKLVVNTNGDYQVELLKFSEPISETTTEDIPINYVPGRNADLGNRRDISVEDMNKVLEYWYNINGTPFYGHAEDFILAADISGLDPIYILSHAAQESGWGRHHLGKNNYFGINAIDGAEIECGYTMGDTMGSGLINGASWISENYYNQGENTLYLMVYGGKCYASAKDEWIDAIECIMETSYEVLKS